MEAILCKACSCFNIELTIDHFLCSGLAALGEFMHPCEDEIVCKCTTDENKVPYFNAPVYLENKEQIGKVDEIFGQLRDFVSFSYYGFPTGLDLL